MDASSSSNEITVETHSQTNTELSHSVLENKHQAFEEARSEYNFFAKLLEMRKQKAYDAWEFYSGYKIELDRLVDQRDYLNEESREKRKEITEIERDLKDAKMELSELQETVVSVRGEIRRARQRTKAALSDFQSAADAQSDAEKLLEMAVMKLESAETAFQLAGGELPQEQSFGGREDNPWIAGSFYLAVAVVIMTLLAVIGTNVPWYVLPVVFMGGVIMIVVIGTLQLQNDDKLKDKEFLAIVVEVLRSLPLFGSLSSSYRSSSSEIPNVEDDNVVPEKRVSEQKLLARLVQALDTGFDEEELRTLCFNLGIDYDNLPSQGKVNKARELVKNLERHNRISELVKIGQQLRPNVSWMAEDEDKR